MKKLLLSSVALMGLTAGAMAADLPMRAAPPAPVAAAVPVFTWTGFYVGVNGGVIFDDDDNDDRFDVGADSGLFTQGRFAEGTGFVTRQFQLDVLELDRHGRNNRDGEGFIGGQVGYNMQFGMFVLGIEADYQGVFGNDDDHHNGRVLGRAAQAGIAGPGGPGSAPAGFGVRGVAPGNNNIALFDTNSVGSIDSFATIRGKVGVAFDRFMIYATGGAAWVDREGNRGNGVAGLPDNFFVATGNTTAAQTRQFAINNTNLTRRDHEEWGWTVGGGAEWAFTNNLSFKIEGLYVMMEETDLVRRGDVVGVTNTGAAIRHEGNTVRQDNDFALVRAGVNFRFNSF